MSLSIGCTDWHSGDICLQETDKGRHYVIYLFGRTAKSSLVTLMITGVRPRGYIEIPMECTLSDQSICNAFHDFFHDPEENLPFYAKKSIANISVVRRNRFRGFDANTSRRYVRVECESRSAIRAVSRMFLRDIHTPDSDRKEQVPKAVYIQGITKGGKKVLPLFEFGIDPLLRFFHDHNIQPAHWICVAKRNLRKAPIKTKAKFTFMVDSQDIQTLTKPPCEIPWVVASFDIECLSSHGSFPQAIKDYKKPARDIVELITHLPKEDLLSRHSFRTLIVHWFLGSGDEKDAPIHVGSKLPSDTSLSLPWRNLHGIFTKQGILPNQYQYDQLVDQLYPLLFDKKGLAMSTRVFRVAETMKDILEPRVVVAPDRVVQIGTSFWRYGDTKPYRHTMVTLGPCSSIPGVDVVSAKTETELLQTWHTWLTKEMPDILTGYNIFGFDIPYLYKRAEDEGVLDTVFQLSRFLDYTSELRTKQVKGIGGTLVDQEYVETPGMVQLDLMAIMKRDHNLDSYKLDNVASTFLRGNVKSLGTNIIHSNSVCGLEPGNSVSLRTTAGYVEETWGKPRYEVASVDHDTNQIHLVSDLKLTGEIPSEMVWCMGKNDVGPQDIFRLCKGTADEQRIIAKYCVQDVVLVLHLIQQLQVLPNNVAMGNVCSVPFGWIVARGQGVKIQSLVAKQCDQRGFLCPDLDKSQFGHETFEGAVVLPPYPGLYLEEPVAVLDYASLYPSSMISVNLSHESYCDDPTWQGEEGAKRLVELGYKWEDIQYDTFSTGLEKHKVKTGIKTVRFVQQPKGIIPQILENLLVARKETRTRMKHKTLTLMDSTTVSGLIDTVDTGEYRVKHEDNSVCMVEKNQVVSVAPTYSSFEKEIMDGQQLAYKITANSLYGQIGARTSYIYWKDIAAATTATGRKQLEIAQLYCEDETNFPQTLEHGETVYLNNKVVYGDTDSVFVKYDCRYPDGSKMTGRDALKRSIELGCKSETGIQQLLKAPQRLEYEKTFWPFILFTKKRYVGDKYEFDPNKPKRTSMGIVLKRRDNAPIVKVLFGGVIDTIMETRQTKRALDELQRGLFDFIRGKYGMNNLIITKTLAPYYKKPQTVAHRILADRIAERDPGNAPQVNDRIPYVHIKIKKPKSKIKPGENIENPEYVKKHQLGIDYGHYISNQIMKPVSQIFALAPHMVPGSRVKEGWFDETWEHYEKEGMDREEARKVAQNDAQKIIQKVLFEDVMIMVKNQDNRQREITDWFRAKP